VRAVHVHRILGIGGSERHLLTLLPALRERGVDASFVGLDGPGAEPFYRELDAAGVPFERIPLRRDLDPRAARALRRELRRAGPDLVHTHLVHADVLGALAALETGATLVSTKHNDDRFRLGPFRFAERALARRAGRVITITEALRRFNVERVGLPAGKVAVVHYGLDRLPEPWGPDDGPDLPADARVLLCVARLVPQKGVDVAAAALAPIRERHPNAHLVILGEGPLRDELSGPGVHLPGRVGDVAAWYRRAEIVVHPARWEGFGLALLEAMLAAKPVVASSVSSIPEIVADGGTGTLVPPDDATALAGAVTALLDDPERAAALGDAGLVRARARFSVGRMAERTLAVYSAAGVPFSPSAAR
jgi:glycosyltransferase involved in cell wall biosynthesis